MKVVNPRNIEIGDIIECLTEDGWESGTVSKITETKVTVFMHYICCNREFGMNLIR